MARRPPCSPLRIVARAALLLGCLSGPAAQAEEPVEWEREADPDVFYVSPRNTDGVTTHVVIRVVDLATGEPIPGASAALFSQDDHPITGLAPPDRTGVADEEGWIRIRADDLGWTPTWQSGYWKYVEAPGYAGVALSPGHDQGEIRLSRARSALVEVRDVLDRPVYGATIGARNSATCGHMPDQRVVVTGLDGRAVVPDVAPSEGQDYVDSWECWVVHPSIESDYLYLEFSSRRGPVQIFRHGPSYPVEGTILDAEGKPAVGLHVGHMGAHRGPWTRTNSQGWFRLEGAPPGARLTVDSPGSPSGLEERWFTAPPPGFHRTFRMPPQGSAAVASATHPAKVLLRDAKSQQPIEGDVPIVAVRDADGFTTDEWSGALPPGTWTVLAGGGTSAWRLTRATLVVPDAKDAPTAPLVLDVARNPDLRIEFSGDPARASVELVTASGVRQVTPEELTARVIPVPVDEECAFRVAYGGRDNHPETYLWLYTPVPKEARGEDAAPIRIANPAPVVIAATFAGPDGKPVPGWLASDLADLLDGQTFASWDPPAPAGLAPEVSVHAEGQVDLLAIPEGSTLAPRVVTVTLPPHALEGGRVDAGVVRLTPRGDTRLTVLAREGTPADYIYLQVVRGHVVRTWFRGEADEAVCDPVLDPLAVGDVVEVLRPAWKQCFLPPIRQRLEGPGPWTIRNDRPERSILVDPIDEAGKPLDATLVVDGTPVSTEAYTDEDGKRHPFEVAGLGAGPHRIALCAKDRLTRLWRVVLKEGEHRTLSGRLRSRPPSPAPK